VVIPVSDGVAGWVADFAAAMFGLSVLIGAWSWSLWWAYRQGRRAQGQANVLSAMERAAAETVVLPRQREPR
jgi:hypothetical protein